MLLFCIAAASLIWPACCRLLTGPGPIHSVIEQTASTFMTRQCVVSLTGLVMYGMQCAARVATNWFDRPLRPVRQLMS